MASQTHLACCAAVLAHQKVAQSLSGVALASLQGPSGEREPAKDEERAYFYSGNPALNRHF